jgi:hypothetical protein
MKRLMILGGIVGFVIGIAFGGAEQSAWPAAFWKSCAAALISGMLLRWWGRVWVSGLKQSLGKRSSEAKLGAVSSTQDKP